MSGFLNLFWFEFSFFFVHILIVPLFFMLNFYIEVLNLFLKLRNVGLKYLLFSHESFKSWIDFISYIFESNVLYQVQWWKFKACVWGSIVMLEPLSYGMFIISLSICCNYRFCHRQFGNGTCPFLLKTFYEVIVFTVHPNNFINQKILTLNL